MRLPASNQEVVTARMVAYTEGYILAMEDVIKDLEEIGKVGALPWGASFSTPLAQDVKTRILKMVRNKVARSLIEARATMVTLRKAQDGDTGA